MKNLESTMYHGIGTMKKDYGNLKKGMSGMVTAYLPDMNKFAINFHNNGGWITFSMREKQFIELVEVYNKNN